MQLDVRNQPSVTHIGAKSVFQMPNAIVRIGEARRIRKSGKIARQGVQVEHRSERRIAIFRHPALQVPLNLAVLADSAAVHDVQAVPIVARHHATHVRNNVERTQVWYEHLVYERFLRLPFRQNVQPAHQ